ncbi:MAG: PEGA domain-containing protein [Fibrobacteria bacterium]|nr:PEGA domain-containing protein [Fibrobacteria bacterium]
MPFRISIFALFLNAFLLQAQDNKPNIAVLDLEAIAVSEIEAKSLTDKLRSELVKTGRFLVIERNQMDEILEEQKFQLSGCTNQECVVEVGQLLGVQEMITGSIGRVGSVYLVSLRTIDVEKGIVLKDINENVPGNVSDILNYGITNAARRIAGLPPLSPEDIINQSNGQYEDGFGDIHLVTEPPGASIYLNDLPQENSVTPVLLKNLPAGNYKIKVVHDLLIGVKSITLKKDDLVKLNLVLQKGKGNLKIYSEPLNTVVLLDNKYAGQTPLLLKDLQAGSHGLLCKQSGYIPFAKKVFIEIDNTIQETCKMIKGKQLSLNALHDKKDVPAAIFINGDSAGITPFYQMRPLGTYNIVLKSFNFRDTSFTVNTNNTENMVFNIFMHHTDKYLAELKEKQRKEEEKKKKRREERKRRQVEQLKKEMEKQALLKQKALERKKKLLKITRWSLRIAGSSAALIGGGMTGYYLSKVNSGIDDYKKIEQDYNNADLNFETYKINYTAKRVQVDKDINSMYKVLGVCFVGSIAFGLSYTF